MARTRISQLNTSVRITFPGCNPIEFDSIEQAVSVLKTKSKDDPRIKPLTEQAIKIRANRYASADRIIPKDNILCEWLDDHTIRYYRAKASKSKGSNWEYKVRDAIRKIGYTGVKTARGESRSTDNNNIDLIDTDNKLPVSVQCKSYKSCPDYNMIRQGCDVTDKPFVVAWHCSQPDDYFKIRKNKDLDIPIEKDLMLIPADYFYELLDAYTRYYHIIK